VLKIICGWHGKIAICKLHNNTAFIGRYPKYSRLSGSCSNKRFHSQLSNINCEGEKNLYDLYLSGLNFKASTLKKFNKDDRSRRPTEVF